MEKKLIKEYCDKYDNQMYNLAGGGEGGDVFKYASEEEKNKFIEKMTHINQERCSSDEFKEKISKATKTRFQNSEERGKQSKRIRESWSDQNLRDKQRQILTEYYKTHKKDNSYNNIPCIFELNNDILYFPSKKELLVFLKEEYNFTPAKKTIKKLIETGEPYKPFHSKNNRLAGMRILLQQDKSVETKSDECNSVGCEDRHTSEAQD